MVKFLRLPYAVRCRYDARRAPPTGYKIDEQSVLSISRIVNALEAANVQGKTEDNRRARREKITIVLLLFTLLATGSAAYYGFKLVEATNDAIVKADSAARIQHDDTLASLKIAADANNNSRDMAVAAKTQADAAEKQVARAWLYISFERTDPPMLINDGSERKNFNLTINYKLTNYGQIPAEVQSVTTYGLAAWTADPIGSPIHPLEHDDRFELIKGMGDYCGPKIISAGETVPNAEEAACTQLFFLFRNHVWIGSTPLFTSPHVVVKVRYSDPHGKNRETCAYVRVKLQR